jgi:hypothetical protein
MKVVGRTIELSQSGLHERILMHLCTTTSSNDTRERKELFQYKLYPNGLLSNLSFKKARDSSPGAGGGSADIQNLVVATHLIFLEIPLLEPIMWEWNSPATSLTMNVISILRTMSPLNLLELRNETDGRFRVSRCEVEPKRSSASQWSIGERIQKVHDL